MAAGYTAFFAYTALMGALGIVLAFLVSRGEPRRTLEREERAEKAADEARLATASA